MPFIQEATKPHMWKSPERFRKCHINAAALQFTGVSRKIFRSLQANEFMPRNWKENIPTSREEAWRETQRASHVLVNHPAHHPIRALANPLNARGWILSGGARFSIMPSKHEESDRP